MNTRVPFFSTGRLDFLGALAACGLVCGAVQAAAQEQTLTVEVTVSTLGLDLSQPAGAHKLYVRLSNAADVVCSHGNRVDLHADSDFVGCYQKALATAVRSVNRPQLTLEYLTTHTLRDAARYGIDLPLSAAAR
jgi:UrcA family protein